MPLLTDRDWEIYSKFLVDYQSKKIIYEDKVKELVGEDIFKQFKKILL